MKFRFLMGALLLGVAVLLPGSSRAAGDNQIGDNLSSYTGVNAQGYLGPLRDAMGASLNSGMFMYAGVPQHGLHLRLEARAMLVNFSDADKIFTAKSESYFGSGQTYNNIPTVVGSEHAITVTDPTTGASFTFPGGFNIDRFGLAVPQITVGSIAGTEAIGRYVAVNAGNNEIGHVKLVGVGLRHSLSSHLSSPPLDLSVGGMWQKFDIGDSLIKTTLTSFGVQAGKSFGILAGYAGLSYDSITMNVNYKTNALGADRNVKVDFGTKSTAHLTLGATLRLGFVHLNGEFNQASNTSLGFGLGFGN